MPPYLKVEVSGVRPDTWVQLSSIRLGDRDGTITDNGPDGRNVYLFGVDPIDNQGYIKKSEFGADSTGHGTRIVHSMGFTSIAALNPGQSFELRVMPDRAPEPVTFRFTYTED